MEILPLNFFMCKLCGMWFKSNNFYLLKMAYRTMVLTFIFQFASSFIGKLLLRENIKELLDILFIALLYFTVCIKIVNFLSKRKEILGILDDLRSSICRPKNPEERLIVNTHSKHQKRIFLTLNCMSMTCCLNLISMPLYLSDGNKFRLPFKTYQPYKITTRTTFWLTYLCQTIASVYAVQLNATLDGMVYGFIIMATAQFKINCCRFRDPKVNLKECIKHHVLLLQLVLKIRNTFMRAVVPVFMFNLVTLCSSIFQVSQKRLFSLEFFGFLLFFCIIMVQIFIYCWSGNQLELQSKAVSDAIYFGEWLEMVNKNRKNVFFVMLFSKQGSKISYHGLCVVTLSTFIWVIKTSYAMWNVLQAKVSKS